MITPEQIKEYLYYEVGKLYWKERKVKSGRDSRFNREWAGKEAGGKTHWSGYVVITIKGIRYPAHRLVYAMFNGWTDQYIDHINGVRCDNRIENLRAATPAQNSQNSKVSSRNKTGVKGVSFNKSLKKFKVDICVEGVKYFGGYFSGLEEAKEVAVALREKLHKDFSNDGTPKED